MNKRQATYLKGIADGKSKKDEALEAGYAPSCAKKAHRVIEGPGIRREFQKIIRSWIDPEKLGQRLPERLDAMETKLAQSEGGFTDERDLTACEMIEGPGVRNESQRDF